MIEKKTSASIFAVDWFRVKAAEVSNPNTVLHLHKAIDSFNYFMGGTPVPLSDIDEDLLNEWVSYLFYKGYKYSSILTYLSKLSALFGKAVKEGLVQRNDCFSKTTARLREIPHSQLEINADAKVFDKLRNLILMDCSKQPYRQIAKDIVLFSVFCGGLTYKQIANYKKDDYLGSNTAILAIVRRYAKPKNKYLFPLEQSSRTPKQLESAIAEIFKDALSWVGIKLSLYSTATPIDLWSIAAMRSGFYASDIAGCIGNSGMINPMFSFAKAAELDGDRVAEIRERVTEVLTKDPDDWYAMQFRPRVNIDMITERMKSCHIAFQRTFYPMEEIVRRVGKKKIYESKPIVPGLLFFKIKASALTALFRHIGDLAWGYRQTRDVCSPYAVISRKAIELYQMTIGQFDESTEVFPAGTLELRPGDRLEIIGGSFLGRPATFDADSRHSGRTVYRLKMLGDNDIEWSIDTDARLVRKISESRYHKLSQALNS